MKIYTFKTNISSEKTASIMLKLLPYYYKIAKIQYDLSRGTSIFTITAKELSIEDIQSTMKEFGYRCQLIRK